MLSILDSLPRRVDLSGGRFAGLFFCGCISLGMLAIAVLFVGFGYLVNASSKSPSAYDSDIIIVSQNTRDVFSLFAKKEQKPVAIPVAATPAIIEDEIPLVAAVQVLPVPRLKPPAPAPARLLAKSIDVNGIWLAENQHYSFADQSDFTGGQEPLFTKYIARFEQSEPTVTPDMIVLASGENLFTALRRAGFDASDSEAAAAALAQEINIRGLRPGTEIRLERLEPALTDFQEASVDDEAGIADDKIVSLQVANDPVKRVHVKRDINGKFFAETEIAETTLHYAAISGKITDSLFASAARAGTPQEVVAKLSNLFLFDVDFQRQIRYGDRFEVVYEVFYDELGRPAGYGDVVYGQMSWLSQSREKGYYRHTDGKGKTAWFDAEGKSANRLLMKTPIEGARITSGFGKRRHPILGYTKQHKGTDFGARRGTPIMAAGDGVVERANTFGSYGKYIRIRHANGYKTAYAHLNGFAKGIRAGAEVQQGQIIGYVGSTGRSTGPHLHYEVMRHNKHINPMNIKMATGKVLEGNELATFIEERDRIEALRLPRSPLVLAQN